jgi:hypothetical protein
MSVNTTSEQVLDILGTNYNHMESSRVVVNLGLKLIRYRSFCVGNDRF